MRTQTKPTEGKTKEFNLEEAFVLWKQTSKDGKEYLSGHDLHNNKILGFYNTNKKNPKEPDITVHLINEEGKIVKEIASLWANVTENKKEYLTGTTDEKEKLVCFYGKKEKAPHIRAYFKEN